MSKAKRPKIIAKLITLQHFRDKVIKGREAFLEIEKSLKNLEAMRDRYESKIRYEIFPQEARDKGLCLPKWFVMPDGKTIAEVQKDAIWFHDAVKLTWEEPCNPEELNKLVT